VLVNLSRLWNQEVNERKDFMGSYVKFASVSVVQLVQDIVTDLLYTTTIEALI